MRCQDWAQAKSKLIFDAAKILSEHVADPMRFIHVDLYLVCPIAKIWTKENQKHRWDTTNRIKGVHDAVSDMLAIDDKHFQCGPTEKVAFEGILEERFCLVQLSVRKIKTFQELCLEQKWV